MLTSNQRSGTVFHEPDAEATSVESLIDQRLSPGMLVLAPPMRLIHMNRTAWEIIQRVSEAEADPGEKVDAASKRAKGLLPGHLRDVCLEIISHLGERPHAKDWERFELKRLVMCSTHPILMRGFGVPAQSKRDESRVVVLLEEVGRRREGFKGTTVERFQLTEREKTVVQCLAKGWTNKEIAGAMRLALPTVKEHIRHIMDKTKTNTRTGILVKMFHT